MSTSNPLAFIKTLYQRLTQPNSLKDSEVHPHDIPRDIARLRRSLARLYKENRHLKSQLSDLGIKRISDGNKDFDADLYRKALELNVKQEVYEKIRNIFGVIVLLGGLGLFLQLKGIVESSVTKEVNSNPQIVSIKEQLNKQLERSQRDTLLALMQAAIGAADQGNSDSWAVQRIEDNKEDIEGYTQQMQELIKQGSGTQERQLAIDYAAQTQDPHLREVLLAECRQSIEPEIRLRMLQALMQYPEETLGDVLDVVKQEGEKSQGEFWQSAVQYISTIEIKDDTPIASEMMSRALQSEDSQIVRSAIAFFTLNPQTWNSDYANLISTQVISEPQLSQLKSLIQVSASTTLSVEKQTQVSHILKSLTTETVNSKENSEETARWQEQLQAMQRHFAKQLLRFGNTQLLAALREGGYQYYSHSDWEEEILNLFPEFEQKNAGVIRSTQTEEEQHKLQDRLIDTLQTDASQISVWNPSKGVYELFDLSGQLDLSERQEFEQISLQMLKQGDRTLFNRYFLETTNEGSSRDYQDSFWSQVTTLFPDATPEQKEDQAAFREWLRTEMDDTFLLLQWNPDNGTYRLVNVTEDSSIAQLNQGSFEQFLLWMSSTYYEEQAWREQVLHLFPDVPKMKLFETYAPMGNQEEQDTLWRWVEENQVLLQWQDDRQEYRLSDR